MQITDYKIISDEKKKNFYLKFKRNILGFIPMWFYLRGSHFSDDYKFFRHAPLIYLVVILTSVFLYYIIPCICAPILLLVAGVFMVIIHMIQMLDASKKSSPFHYNYYKKEYDEEGINDAKRYFEKHISDFNYKYIKIPKKEVYSSKKSDDKYYHIQIPKLKNIFY